MRVGLFTDTYLPEMNGVITVIRLMERELTREGHEVHIFAPAYPGRRATRPHVYRFPSMRFAYYPGMRTALPYNRRALSVIPSLDLIHSHDPGAIGLLALQASRIYRIPHIHTYHTLYREYRRYLPRAVRPTEGMVIRLSRAFCNRCHAIVAPSGQMKRELESYGIRVPVYALPFGLDEEEFSQQTGWDARAELNLPGEDQLLYVGRLGMEKNLPFLLRAFHRLLSYRPTARLVIAGEGPQCETLKELAAKLDIAPHVIFIGRLKRQQLIALYRQATLFVFASKTETQGLVLLEAMMAGSPVVALGKMGVLDVVRPGETGILVEEDEDQFARACLRLLEDRGERDRMGKLARQWAYSNSSRESIRCLLEIYAAVGAREPAAAATLS